MLQLLCALTERLDMCAVGILEHRSPTAKVEEDTTLTTLQTTKKGYPYG
jgi:hypothetical protein